MANMSKFVFKYILRDPEKILPTMELAFKYYVDANYLKMKFTIPFNVEDANKEHARTFVLNFKKNEITDFYNKLICYINCKSDTDLVTLSELGKKRKKTTVTLSKEMALIVKNMLDCVINFNCDYHNLSNRMTYISNNIDNNIKEGKSYDE